MAIGLWIMERCASERFPYRLQILKGRELWLSLRVSDRWPAANRNIFCLREREPPRSGEILEEVERVPVVALQRRGRRLSVVLDRKRCKRCDFLFLTKAYKARPSEEYEQIFWQTQQSMRQRRPRVWLPTAGSQFTVRVASEERYPWRFPGSTIVRGRLPVGDYALVDGDEIITVVERKTFESFLSDLGTMPWSWRPPTSISSTAAGSITTPLLTAPPPSPSSTQTIRPCASSSAPTARRPTHGRGATSQPCGPWSKAPRPDREEWPARAASRSMCPHVVRPQAA